MQLSIQVQEFVVELVIIQKLQAPLIVERTMYEFSDAAADLVLLEITSVAHELQEVYYLRDAGSVNFGYQLYKFAALLACEIAAIRALGNLHPKCSDLVVRWASEPRGRFFSSDTDDSVT